MLVYLKECENFCLSRRAGEEAEKREFAVIGTRDMADLIQAALVHSKRVKAAGIELRGPSVVSVYNALVSLYRLQEVLRAFATHCVALHPHPTGQAPRAHGARSRAYRLCRGARRRVCQG